MNIYCYGECTNKCECMNEKGECSLNCQRVEDENEKE